MPVYIQYSVYCWEVSGTFYKHNNPNTSATIAPSVTFSSSPDIGSFGEDPNKAAFEPQCSKIYPLSLFAMKYINKSIGN
jgi:hypothetical protein